MRSYRRARGHDNALAATLDGLHGLAKHTRLQRCFKILKRQMHMFLTSLISTISDQNEGTPSSGDETINQSERLANNSVALRIAFIRVPPMLDNPTHPSG